jgi:hypothetical protein
MRPRRYTVGKWFYREVFVDTIVSPQKFIEAWQTSNSVAEVASKLRMKKNQVRVRACRYRQRGVPLKEFPPVPLPVVDWEGLSQYAAELVACNAGVIDGAQSENDVAETGQA